MGTYLIGAVNLVAAVLAVLPISYLGRRTILLSGHLWMMLMMGLTGVGALMGWNMTLFICILLFVWGF
jgi:hypothetical protein